MRRRMYRQCVPRLLPRLKRQEDHRAEIHERAEAAADA